MLRVVRFTDEETEAQRGSVMPQRSSTGLGQSLSEPKALALNLPTPSSSSCSPRVLATGCHAFSPAQSRVGQPLGKALWPWERTPTLGDASWTRYETLFLTLAHGAPLLPGLVPAGSNANACCHCALTLPSPGPLAGRKWGWGYESGTLQSSHPKAPRPPSWGFRSVPPAAMASLPLRVISKRH